MRLPRAVMVTGVLMTAAATAQALGGTPALAAEGNRANGLDYQPTPGEVVPREKAAGIQPPAAQQNANNQLLERLDKNLLHGEGLSTKSVPKLTTGQQHD